MLDYLALTNSAAAFDQFSGHLKSVSRHCWFAGHSAHSSLQIIRALGLILADCHSSSGLPHLVRYTSISGQSRRSGNDRSHLALFPNLAYQCISSHRRYKCSCTPQLLHILVIVFTILLHPNACITLVFFGQDVPHAPTWGELVHLGCHGCERVRASH